MRLIESLGEAGTCGRSRRAGEPGYGGIWYGVGIWNEEWAVNAVDRGSGFRAAAAIVTIAARPICAQERPDAITPLPAYELDELITRGDLQVGATGGVSDLVAFPDSLKPCPTIEDALRELPVVLVRQNSRGIVENSMRDPAHVRSLCYWTAFRSRFRRRGLLPVAGRRSASRRCGRCSTG